MHDAKPETPLQALDRQDRSRWIYAAIGILIETTPLNVRQVMVGGGEQAFHRVAMEAWGPHRFHLSDFRYAWRVLVASVEPTFDIAKWQRVH